MSRRPSILFALALMAILAGVLGFIAADAQAPSDQATLDAICSTLDGHEHYLCSTVPPETTAPATTTTVAATTTTAPPPSTTTSLPPTTVTTAPDPTTSVAPTTTTGPPSGDFVADFATPEDFYDRFLLDVHYRDRARRDTTSVWPGDHNHACEAPTTHRDVSARTDAELFWWCAPAGPDSGHVMTSMGDVDGYTIISFAPNQVFARADTSRVCWSQNLTDEGGRKWTQVALIPRASWEANGRRLDYISPVTQDVDQTALPLPAESFMLQNWDHAFRIFSGTTELLDDWNQFHTGTDVARRYRHCIVDNGNGTITVSQERNTGTLSRTVNASFPSEFIVIAQDDSYTPDKDGEGLGFRTWHWDNVEIS